MAKLKKILKSIYIIVCIAIATIVLNKIFAATVTEGERTLVSGYTEYGIYKVTEVDSTHNTVSEASGEVLGKIPNKDSMLFFAQGNTTITDSGSRTNWSSNDTSGILIGELMYYNDIFCLNKHGKLPSYNGLGDEYIKKLGNGKDIYKKYSNGNFVEEGENVAGKDRYDFKDQKNATEAQYYSRKIELNNLNVKETYTSNADGYTGEKNLIDWDVAYILSKSGQNLVYYPDDSDEPIDVDDEFSENDFENKEAKIKIYNVGEELYSLYCYDQYQWAIWKCKNKNDIDLVDKPEAERLYNESQTFNEYRKNIEENGSFVSVEENDEYTFKYNKDGDFFIAGPIKINYQDVGELYHDKNNHPEKCGMNYGEIVDYHVYGEYEDIEDPVEIENFMFTDENGNQLLDENNMAIFPKANNTFYIRVDNNDPIYSEGDRFGIKKITSFDASFKYLDVEASAYEIYDDSTIGVIQFYEWELKSESKTNTNTETGTTQIKRCSECHKEIPWIECPEHPFAGVYYEDEEYETETETTTETKWLERKGKSGTYDINSIELQRILVLRSARLFWRNFKLEIDFTGDDDNPSTGTPTTGTPTTGTPTTGTPTTGTPTTGTPTTGTPTTGTPTTGTPTTGTPTTGTPSNQRTSMDIGGKVWVDVEPVLKESAGDGISGTDQDYPRKNVLVKLFFEDGQQVKLGETTVNGKTVKVIDPKNQNKLVERDGNKYYEMYTDDNGNYMFYNLPFGPQYYVEFTYDGLSYEPVTAFANGSKEDYLGKTGTNVNANKDVYKNNSKIEENKSIREDFNDKFAKILYYSENLSTNKVMEMNSVDEPKRKQHSFAVPQYAYANKLGLDYYTTRVKETMTVSGGATEERWLTRSRIQTTDKPEDDTAPDAKQSGKVVWRCDSSTIRDTHKDTNNVDYSKITANTKDMNILYPLLQDGSITIDAVNNSRLISQLEYLKHINLGLKRRTKADISLATQITAGATTIKDKSKVVPYKNVSDEALKLDFTGRLQQYITQEISASDYNWKATYGQIYGDNSSVYAVNKDKLDVYVLYRIAVTNQCEDINDYGIVEGLIDYYSNELEMVPADEIKTAFNLFTSGDEKVITTTVPTTATSSWIEGTTTPVTWKTQEYKDNNRYTKIETDVEITVQNGAKNTQAVYLILKVKENGNVLFTGSENGQKGMENIAEIRGYQIRTSGNMPAGKVDQDSIPGNAIPGNTATYEDDTSAAPMFKLELNWEPKKISGYVWDDANKNGVRDSGENGVKDVTVKLYEYIVKDGNVKKIPRPGLKFNNNTVTANINDSIKTGLDGKYEFYVEGGNYSVEFIYGDTSMLQTNAKYNAQDYQATKYQSLADCYVGLDNSDPNKAFKTSDELKNINSNRVEKELSIVVDASGNEYAYNETTGCFEKISIGSKPQSNRETEAAKASDVVNQNLSFARDDAEVRARVIESTQSLTYTNSSKLNELNNATVNVDTATMLSGENNNPSKPNYTYMEAVSDIIQITSNDIANVSKTVNLGLKERPKATIKLEKQVDRIVLTAVDGTVLIDTGDAAKHTNLATIDDDIQTALMYLPESAMDGTTIDVYYTITATKNGEPDYLINYEYEDEKTYRENSANDRAILKELSNKLFAGKDYSAALPLKATIYDYVKINLEYRADDNKHDDYEWKVIDDITAGNIGDKVKIDLKDTVKNKLPRENKTVSKVLWLETKDFFSTNNEKQEFNVHLGMTLSENSRADGVKDDFLYNNCAEVVQISTGAGRRDYGTIQGNYEPYTNPEDYTLIVDGTKKIEGDSALTGTTTIIPPTGQERIYYVIAITVATILIVGIVVIKKKVLKK